MATLEQQAANIRAETVHGLATAGKDVIDFFNKLIPRDANGHVKITPQELGTLGIATLGAILYTERQYRLEHPQLQNASIPDVLNDMRQHPQEVLSAAHDGLPGPLQKGADALGSLFDDIRGSKTSNTVQTHEMPMPALLPASALTDASSLQQMPDRPTPSASTSTHPQTPPFYPPGELAPISPNMDNPDNTKEAITDASEDQMQAGVEPRQQFPKPTGPIYGSHGPDIGTQAQLFKLPTDASRMRVSTPARKRTGIRYGQSKSLYQRMLDRSAPNPNGRLNRLGKWMLQRQAPNPDGRINTALRQIREKIRPVVQFATSPYPEDADYQPSRLSRIQAKRRVRQPVNKR